VRQNTKRRTTNRARRTQVKTLVKRFDTAMDEGNAKTAAEQFQGIVKKLDKVANTSTMHKKTAARKKSRLAKRLNALKGKQPASA
jgi:small subunit ribosomal protein S20